MGDKTPETITLTEAIVLIDARAEALGQQPRRAAGRKKAGRKPGSTEGPQEEGREPKPPRSRRQAAQEGRQEKGRQDRRGRIADNSRMPQFLSKFWRARRAGTFRHINRFILNPFELRFEKTT